MEADILLEKIADSIRQCRQCRLHQSRKNAVPGVGPANAEIMLIGEGPGFHENEQGLPFVGQAGKFLDELLQQGGFAREKVFITNVVKCRPPGNREPQPDELEACSSFLENQIAVINPLVIVTLGRFSMARYFENAKISTIHGQPAWHGHHFIIPMYHPAAGLHQPNLKTTIMNDFSHLAEMVEKAKQKHAEQQPQSEKKANQADDSSTQLSLF